MKNILITLLLPFVIVFAQQTEIDGKLKVKGEIDASGNRISNIGTPESLTDAINGLALNSALADDRVYEYMWIVLDRTRNNNTGMYYINYFIPDVTTGSYGNTNFIDFLNSKMDEGWLVHHFDGGTDVILKKPKE